MFTDVGSHLPIDNFQYSVPRFFSNNKILCILFLVLTLVPSTLFFAPTTRATTDKLYFIHQDNLGSTTVITDETGKVVYHERHFPYGKKRGSTADKEQIITERDYTGQIQDHSIRLHYYNARYYDTLLGTFISADTLGEGFGYAGGNPIMNTDPSGHMVDPGGAGSTGTGVPTIDFASFVEGKEPTIQDVGNVMNYIAEEYKMTESEIIYHFLLSYMYNNPEKGESRGMWQSGASAIWHDAPLIARGNVLSLSFQPAGPRVMFNRQLFQEYPRNLHIENMPIEVSFGEGEKMDLYQASLAASQSYILQRTTKENYYMRKPPAPQALLTSTGNTAFNTIESTLYGGLLAGSIGLMETARSGPAVGSAYTYLLFTDTWKRYYNPADYHGNRFGELWARNLVFNGINNPSPVAFQKTIDRGDRAFYGHPISQNIWEILTGTNWE